MSEDIRYVIGRSLVMGSILVAMVVIATMAFNAVRDSVENPILRRGDIVERCLK